MELYSSARPESCLGCGSGISAGDVVVPTESIGPEGSHGSGWLLCLGCGAGLLLGQPLPAWAVAAEPAPGQLDEPVEPGWSPWPDERGELGSASPWGWTDDPGGSSERRLAAMQAHPGNPDHPVHRVDGGHLTHMGPRGCPEGIAATAAAGGTGPGTAGRR